MMSEGFIPPSERLAVDEVSRLMLDDGDVYILTVIDRGTDRIEHQEVFSGVPRFSRAETGYDSSYYVTIRVANVNGGDSVEVPWGT